MKLDTPATPRPVSDPPPRHEWPGRPRPAVPAGAAPEFADFGDPHFGGPRGPFWRWIALALVLLQIAAVLQSGFGGVRLPRARRVWRPVLVRLTGPMRLPLAPPHTPAR